MECRIYSLKEGSSVQFRDSFSIKHRGVALSALRLGILKWQ